MDFTAVVGQQLFFDPNSTSHVVPVEIIDDDNFEKQTESFSATLSTDVPQLQLNTESAIVNITDNDSESDTCNTN